MVNGRDSIRQWNNSVQLNKKILLFARVENRQCWNWEKIPLPSENANISWENGKHERQLLNGIVIEIHNET